MALPLTLRKTRVNNFRRVLTANPRFLTRNPYFNYMRAFKAKHRHYRLPKLLQRGARSWIRMSPAEQDMYSQKRILPPKVRPHIRAPGSLLPPKKFGSSHSPSIPRFTMPNSYRRHTTYTPRTLTRPRNIISDSDSD